jgi:NAD(P)-dependent dehydrogenase (short-subunit alcohol dehydrogenase family)
LTHSALSTQHSALTRQVVVITGASSGIGREAALQFGQAGATVVLAARNGAALEEAAAQVARLGGQAQAVPTDVANWDEVERLARTAVEKHGRVDTWVNNAAVSEYALFEDMTIEEIDRIVRVNLLGQIYGCKAALTEMKRQGSGTIVCVASALAIRGVPLQSIYCATKHGLKGFVDSLRLELERENPAINVSLVMPSSINTPLFSHARSKMTRKPMPIPPVYEPRAVAEVLVEVACHPRRDVVVGGSGKLLTVAERLSPGLLDRYMLQGGRMFRQQLSDRPDDGADTLFRAGSDTGSTTGEFGAGAKSASLYTGALELHPARKNALAATMLLGAALMARRLLRPSR